MARVSHQLTSLQERYQLAASLAFGQRASALKHGAVRPNWSADGRHFWYEVAGPSGLLLVLVDVLRRARTELADRAALALAWQQATGAALDPVPADPPFAPHEAVCPDGSAAVSLDGPNLRLRERVGASRLITSDGETDWGYGQFTDLVSQISQRLSDQPRQPSVLWSPDSRRLAVLRSDLRRMPLLHLVQSVPRHGVRPALHSCRYDMPGDEGRAEHALWFIGRDGQRVRARTGPLQAHVITPFAAGQQGRWSADGRHFFLVDGNRDSTVVALWRIDASTGESELLVEEAGPGLMRASPTLAEPPLFHPLSDGRVVWWSQRSGWGQWWMTDTGGAAVPITQGEWQVRSLMHVDEARQQILFTAAGREPGVDPYLCHAYGVNFDGSALRLLTPEPAHHECAASPDGHCFVDNFSTVATPPRALLRRRDGEVLVELERAEPGMAWPSTMPLPEPFALAAQDGRTALWGVLFKPPGFVATERYPVIEVIYGAPQTAVVPKTWLPNIHGSFAEQLAALGFVVVMLDGPGTSYRSHAFQLDAHGRVESCGSLPDHVAAIRHLAGTRPWMDLDRVGITGGSGGGYATVRAMGTYPDFYQVGVAMCGNHDQAAYTAMWGETFQGPYSAERYAAQANASVASNITGALLLMHGEMDDNVHPAHTLRVADALIQADRDFEMLIVPNAGHMLINLPYVRRRAYDHFVRHLLRLQPPRRTA
jgi:dipeptidyl aminopeptidase/acylaminoacyl peptidase